jgi:hypothetical protein
VKPALKTAEEMAEQLFPDLRASDTTSLDYRSERLAGARAIRADRAHVADLLEAEADDIETDLRRGFHFTAENSERSGALRAFAARLRGAP